MSFRLVPKSVTLNDLERRNGRYFALFQGIFVHDVAVKQLLGLPRFQNIIIIIIIRKFITRTCSQALSMNTL